MAGAPLTEAGWPRPVVGGLPIPWVSPPDDLATMSGARMLAAATGAVCAVCGLGHQDDGEAYALARSDAGAWPPDPATMELRPMDQAAAMHRECLLLALRYCPRLRALREQGVLAAARVETNPEGILRADSDAQGGVFAAYPPGTWAPVALEEV